MSAAEREAKTAPPPLPDPRRSDRQLSDYRALMIADFATVQKQNTSWLSRRFGFQHQLAAVISPRDGKALGLGDVPFDRLPARRRWATLLRRAVLARDQDARRRIRAAIEWRIRGRPGGIQAPPPLLPADNVAIDEQTYAAWIEHYDTLGAADLVTMRAAVSAGSLPPIVAVLRFDAATASRAGPIVRQLQAQLLDTWRALFVLAPDLPEADARRISTIARSDPRIALGPIGAGAGGHAVLLDPRVTLRPETLFAFAETVRQDPSLRLVYADEDCLGPDGTRRAPSFKPRFSPAMNDRIAYLGACVCVADADRPAEPPADIAEWAGALASRLRPEAVARIPRVLFHRDDADGPAPRPRNAPAPPPVSTTPTVAIIIPTRNHAALLEACIDSIWRVSDYPADKLRIIVLDNGSDEAPAIELLDRLRRDRRVTVLADPLPFNYARINNVAAAAASEDILVFLNNDAEAIEPGWLATMVGWAAKADIGVVGPRLLYPDHTIQHAGVVLGIGGVAGHSFVGLPAAAPGYLGTAGVAREAAAVTGACIAVRRAVFEEIGGFDERLEIAFNDTALCCEAIHRGYRNIYVGDVAVLHHESKSRGFDDTPEKLARFRHECLLVRSPYKDLFDNDPYYSPNLGLERQYQPAIPRAPRVWRGHRRAIDPQPRILILSDVHAIGHGVPVVIKEHAEYLAAQGCTVFVGGKLQANEIAYAGCLRVYFDDPLEAQSFAVEADVDCVIAHTMPYFSMFRLMSDFPRRVIFDHGEPPPAWFPDQRDRENIDAEKQFCYRLCELVLTNTGTVKDEIGYGPAEVAGLGNSHLATWDASKALQRDAIRAALGLAGKFVVLNVCRFHRPERQYKGIDDYVALQARLRSEQPDVAGRVVFVLCGKGTEADRAEMEEAGLTVFSNVSDAALVELYVAADLYVNFSKWEGFNLGIAQALAMGLDVVASDIAAHRQFPIATADELDHRVALISQAARADASPRAARLMSWTPLLEWLHRRLAALCDSLA